ncbi:MAG: SHOCT domain-containing protein [Candidatus Andersenbacteria bacterium]|nr:SHOCT domain-containing protein [Candidatus Andersenbacteria bacterium]MBI3250824.1 SHOCT domain-containing protein [Candidatus Andersenbacteria bacterium]
MHYGFWGGSPFMFLWWILIVVLVVLVIKGLRHRGMTMHQGRTTALDILNERYAKGEISKQEFEEKKKDIS